MFSPTQSGGGETHVFSGEARQRSSSLKENLDVCEGDRGGSCRFQSPSLFLFPNPPALVCGGGSRNRRALFSSVRRRCLLGLLGLLQFLSSLRANSKILGEARSAEFGRRQAPAEKPNRSTTAAAEAEAGGRENFIRAEKRQQKVDVFAHPKWGGETHVFSGEARQRSSSLKENLDVCEGDRGGSCRFQSPSLFLFPNPPALVCGGGSRNRRALFSSVRRRCLLGLLGLLQFLSSLRANSKILGEARSAEFSSARRQLKNQIWRSQPPTQRGRVIERLFLSSRETAAESSRLLHVVPM